MKLVTIRDVAKRAGVSTATVSHVLNRTGRVSQRTRGDVTATIRKLHYVPNIHARNLASASSRTLGMIVSDIENPFFPEVIKGFERRAREQGYDVILSDTNYNPALLKSAAERMLEQKVRGVAIMTSEANSRLIRQLVGRHVSVTLLDVGRVQKYVSEIELGYKLGISRLLDHLYALGHRHMAFVGGKSALKSNFARQQAYLDGMRALRLKPGPVLAGNLRFDGGLAAGSTIATMDPMPTAVVAINDVTAIGVMRALARAGLNVPRDISVTGFDGTQFADCVTPSLTTADLRRELLGRTAADALHDLATSSNHMGKKYSLTPKLKIGDSTAPPRAAMHIRVAKHAVEEREAMPASVGE
jgi:DNA-binding LacI/PurR family transcriptional regulator